MRFNCPVNNISISQRDKGELKDEKINKRKQFKTAPHKQISPLQDLILLGFNDTSTLMGLFVLSPREREKRDKRESRGDERVGQGRKREMNESQGTEEITTLPLYPYLLQGQQALANCLPISVGHPGDKSYRRTPSPHPTTPTFYKNVHEYKNMCVCMYVCVWMYMCVSVNANCMCM